MKIGLAQLNPTIGDLKGNFERAEKAYHEATTKGAQLVVFPELSVIGYCPKDLLAKSAFREAVFEYEYKWAGMTHGGKPAILFGSISKNPFPFGKNIRNAAIYAHSGCVLGRTSKSLLPTYDVFDEERWFQNENNPRPIEGSDGRMLGVCICEDIWNDKEFWNERLYGQDPVTSLIDNGAEIIINLSASPYALGKPAVRRKMLGFAAKKYNKTVIYVNQVGANDDVVYDGRSMVFCPNGELVHQLPAFKEAVEVIDTDDLIPFPFDVADNETRDVFDAMVLGVKDYARKCGFKSALIGLSGGIDSALTAAVAVQAMGADNVLGVGMPSSFSSDGSVKDAKQLALNLGMPFRIVPIPAMYDAYHMAMNEPLDKDNVHLWEENLQARIRGGVLMSISNKEGRLLLTTGNKSEVAVGYCTLYGDTCGGLAVLSDVFKTRVYDISRWYNKTFGAHIPVDSIDKAPSAELRPNQKDQDSLPPYAELDAMLRLLIEEDMEPAQVADQLGFEFDKVQSIATKVDRNEYKRRQLAPGIRVTKKAFGTGRLVPIAQGWRS